MLVLLISEPLFENHCLTYFEILEDKDYLWNLPLLFLCNSACGSVHQTTPTFFSLQDLRTKLHWVYYHILKLGIFLLNLFHPLCHSHHKDIWRERGANVLSYILVEPAQTLYLLCIGEGITFQRVTLTPPSIAIGQWSGPPWNLPELSFKIVDI